MQGDYEKLKALVLSIEDEVKKAVAGNKSAGTRVRKAMQEVKNLAQAIRVDLLEKRDASETGSPSAPGKAPIPVNPPTETPNTT
jgi:hypothetical protein